MNKLFPEQLGLENLINAGGEISIKKDFLGDVFLDLNTGMKSHMYLYYEDGEWIARMRYDYSEPVQSWEEILDLAKECLHGRKYMHAAWKILLTQDGFNLDGLNY